MNVGTPSQPYSESHPPGLELQVPGQTAVGMAKMSQKEMDLWLQQQQEAERKRQEYISLKEKEAELQRISEEKRRIELEQRRKQLNARREKMIDTANIKRQNEQIVQDRIIEEKAQLDKLRSLKRDSVQRRLEEDLIYHQLLLVNPYRCQNESLNKK